MKRTTIFVLLSLILALCGCAVKEAPVLETIECPEIPNVPAFYLSADLPSELTLISSCEDGKSAVFAHEDYLVSEEIFEAASMEEALRYVTGRDSADVALMTVSTFPQTEYRLAWTAAGEYGDQVCSATMFSDGTFYYALTVQCDASAANAYRTVVSDILATTELALV